MTPIDFVRLTALRDRTSGSPMLWSGSSMVLSQLTIPTWPTKTLDRFRKARRRVPRASSTACLHGAFNRRASGAPAICPSWTLAKCRRSSAVAAAYEKNCRALFYALDELEKRLTPIPIS